MDMQSFMMGMFFGVLLMIFAGVSVLCFSTWIRAALSGVRISPMVLLGMKLRGTPPRLITDALIMLRKQGKDLSLDQIEVEYLAYRSSIHTLDDLIRIIDKNNQE